MSDRLRKMNDQLQARGWHKCFDSLARKYIPNNHCTNQIRHTQCLIHSGKWMISCKHVGDTIALTHWPVSIFPNDQLQHGWHSTHQIQHTQCLIHSGKRTIGCKHVGVAAPNQNTCGYELYSSLFWISGRCCCTLSYGSILCCGSSLPPPDQNGFFYVVTVKTFCRYVFGDATRCVLSNLYFFFSNSIFHAK